MRDVGRKLSPRDFELAQPRRHLVEGYNQLTDLATRADWDPLLQVARGQGLSGPAERSDRRRHGSSESRRQGARHDRGASRASGDRDVELYNRLLDVLKLVGQADRPDDSLVVLDRDRDV